MRSLTVCSLAVLLAGGVTLSAAAQDKKTPSAAEKVRQALDQKMTLDFTSQNFNDGIDHLRQKAKLNITLDQNLFLMLPGQDNVPMPVHLKVRSEEHTSELQSRGHIVCRLLLEKKKNPKATAEMIDSDGWCHTSDVVVYDNDGYFIVFDNMK